MRRFTAAGKARWWFRALCAAVLVICLCLLGRYLADLGRTKRRQQVRSSLYVVTDHAPAAAAVTPWATMQPEPTLPPAAETAQIPTAEAPAAPREDIPVMAQVQKLPYVVYPDNPYGLYQPSLTKLHDQYPDARGWLQVDGVVNDAVFMRNNTYYLTHDADGHTNSNGALFLDEQTVFHENHRPYTFIIYGHNMKTGAMFGNLRKYQQQSWYAEHPFIRFNSLYEDGQYVIFSVLTINATDPDAPAYLPIYQLYSSDALTRAEVLQQLQTRSGCSSRVPVEGHDQILLLVTCNGNDEERLVVAARRIRAEETEAVLRGWIN